MSTLLFYIFLVISPLLSLGISSDSKVEAQVATSTVLKTTTVPVTGVTVRSTPERIRQGDPLLIELVGFKPTDVKKASFLGLRLDFFEYNKKTVALAAVDLPKKPGDYDIVIDLNNGTRVQSKVTVESRIKKEISLPIPPKLGGDTPQATKKLVTDLDRENAELNVVYRKANKTYWTKPFILPVDNPIITDGYATTRNSEYVGIPHKGLDFRASVGTPVKSVNRGVVRVVKKFTVYGNTIIVDHGFGLHVLYMHLSKINVIPGQLVLPGQVIGLSGETGYASGPHLHISVKINGISIDPAVFLDLFKT